jgi:hypothetical protein
MTKFEVIAQSCNPKTGKPSVQPSIEVIDTKKNELFKQCRTMTDVLEAYQAFWNRFPTKQAEMVLVHSIKRLGK